MFLIEACIIIKVISQQKTHFCLRTKVRFLNDVCLRQMMLATPMMTATPNDVCLAAHEDVSLMKQPSAMKCAFAT